MEIENLTAADIDELSELQPDGWPDIKPIFTYYLSAKCFLPIKVEANNSLVGIGTGIIYKDTAWIAHVIVRKEHRRQGIGMSIVKETIA